ncbi:TonB-dependent receptor [Altererythrobacter sp. GH1-8]|uniref:TonB-dependent receptor n=1 Tax=Altererythrobacter sp. GH1-8 TaxID=3349333 RepID=UPI00374DAF91
MKYDRKLMCGAAFAALISTSSAVAQEAEEMEMGAETNTSSNVILVTARKIEESIQEVPISISAFSAEDIKAKSIADLEDVALLTPGLTFEDFANGGYGVPTIRGANQFNIDALETNVSVFIDGIYIPRQYAFDLGSTNLERIEVVKGPQSALYGNNAFAGAINYITTSRELSDFSASGEIGFSEDDGFDIIAKANLPIVPEVFSARIGIGHTEFGGGIPNNHPDADAGVYPGTDGKIGGYNKEAMMFGLSLSPVSALKVDLDYYRFDTFTEGGAAYRIESSNGDTICGNANGLYCGKIPFDPIPGPSGTEGIVKDPRSYGLDAETRIYRVGANLEITDNISISYLFGNIKGEVFSAGGIDKDPLVGAFGGAANFFTFGPVGNYEYETHEARLEFEADNGIYATIGAFDLSGDDFNIFAFGVMPFRDLTPITAVPAGAFQTTAQTLTESQAIFGRIAIPLIEERLTVSAEGRYADEDKEVVGTGFTYSDSYFTPRISVDFQATPDNLFYASVAKGTKIGGINVSTFAGLIDEERFFGPDENWTYEIGSKNVFDGGRGILNVALFYIDWANLQVPQTPTGAPVNTATITTNIGGASSKGAELEGQYELIDGFVLNAGLAYIDATYDEGTISGRLLRAGVCDDVICNADGDIGGNTLQRSAKWQWNFGAAYDAPITASLDLFGRVDVAGQSKMWTDESNTGYIQPRTLVNARLGVKSEHWSLAFWAKNLLNEKYVANAFFTAAPFGTSYVPARGNPRRIGATLGFNF